MATTTFSGPIRSGTVRENEGQNVGWVILSQTNTMTNADTTPKELFTIPAGSQILDITIDVTTAFNSTGTNLIDIGKSGVDDHFVADAAVSTTGRTTGTQQLANWADVGTSDVTVTGTYTQSIANSTAGAARVTIWYVQT